MTTGFEQDQQFESSEDECRVEFNAGGCGHEHALVGWANAEASYCWTVGGESTLRFPQAKKDFSYSLGFSIAPLIEPNNRPFQRLEVLVNHHSVAKLVVRNTSTIELEVDHEFLNYQDTLITFRLRDAAAPKDLFKDHKDGRPLAFRFSWVVFKPLRINLRDRSGALSDQEIMMSLQSLGVNCEVGFAQRAYHANAFGLLRWNSITLEKLLIALPQRFAGLGAPENTEVIVDGASEIMIVDKKFGFRNHSHAYENKGDNKEAIYRRELVRIPFMVRMLIEELEGAKRLFVFHDAGQSTYEDVKKLLVQLREYNARNVLLWVTTADDSHPPGTVNFKEEGLLQGYLDTFQPLRNVKKVSQECWLAVARQAYILWSHGANPVDV